MIFWSCCSRSSSNNNYLIRRLFAQDFLFYDKGRKSDRSILLNGESSRNNSSNNRRISRNCITEGKPFQVSFLDSLKSFSSSTLKKKKKTPNNSNYKNNITYNNIYNFNNNNRLFYLTANCSRNFSSWHRTLFKNPKLDSTSHNSIDYNIPFHSDSPLNRSSCPNVVSSCTTFKSLNSPLFRPCSFFSSFKTSLSINSKCFYGTTRSQTTTTTNSFSTTNSGENTSKTKSTTTLDHPPQQIENSRLTYFKGDLKENIHTIPNLLTCCRMVSAPILSYLVLNGHFTSALGLFVCAGITDLLDGYIARNFKNQNSMLGTALDPLADKILVSFLTVSLTLVDLIPFPLLLIIIGRDLGLIGICFYIRYVSLPPPKTLKRYFDVTHATAELSPTFLSKVNTAVQLSLLALTVAAPVFGFQDHILLQTLWYVTGTTTILSACGYFRERKNVVKILKANSNLN